MPAGLVDIISYGSQDLFLTGSPQITFFKVVYRRYTNFAMESFDIQFDSPSGFGMTSDVILQPIGDLIYKMYLKIKLPRISFLRFVIQDIMKNSYQDVIKAYNEYRRVLTFMHVNLNAYRAAIEIYLASNIIYSEEMVAIILKIFDLNSGSEDVDWFYNNSPINYISPSKFNLLIIAEEYQKYLGTGNPEYDPLIVPKEKFKHVLDQAISYSKTIQLYYEEQLSNAIILNNDAMNPHYKFAWVDRIGHAILDYIDISIGGERIDRQYGTWINIWYELSGKKNQSDIYMKMIGQVSELTNFDRNEKPEYTLYIPLQFWFNRFNGLSIPLVALQYADVNIAVKLKKFRECAYIEDTFDFFDYVNFDNLINEPDSMGRKRVLEASLLVDYIYLDSLERKKFAQSSHEYLIDQVQVLYLEGINNEHTQIELDFYHPCKEIIWVLQKQAFIDNKTGFTKSRWDNYTPTKFNRGFLMEYASLNFNGYPRFDRLKEIYFNYLQPYDHHSNSPSDGVNVYSFALRPEEQQPTGSCNFTRITRAILNLWIRPDAFFYRESDLIDDILPDKLDKLIHTDLNLWIFGLSHNVLRLISGMGGLAYV